MELNMIHTRNGDVGGKEQIKVVMEQNIIYMRNGDVGAKRNKNIAIVEPKKSSIRGTDM
jgi:hypothetical protein